MDPIEKLLGSIHPQLIATHGNDVFFIYATWILEICDKVLESPKSSKLITENTRQIFSYANKWVGGEINYDDFCANCYSMKAAKNIEETLQLVIYNLIDFIDGENYFVGLLDDSSYQLFNCEKKLTEFLYDEPEQTKISRMDNVMRLIELSQTNS